MVTFKVMNELSLEITADHGDVVFTKAGAFIGGKSQGGKNYQFEKVLLGPQGNLAQAAIGHLARRVTGENLPLMKVSCQGRSQTYYANEAQHIVVCKLQPGEILSVESENILAFTSDCQYSVRFLASGVISQKGFMTSVLKGTSSNSQAAILVDGNPLILDNRADGSTIEVDPDSMVAFLGSDPQFKLDLSWKNLIGQASGESYMMQWGPQNPAAVVYQPNERKSGINIGMDGGSSGQRASRQQNQSFGQAGQSIQSTLGQLGSMFGGMTGGGNPMGGGGNPFGGFGV